MFAAIDWFLEYGDFDEAQLECLQFQHCRFLQDFGPFKQGEIVDCLAFNFVEGTCTEYIDGGAKQGRQCKFAVAAFDASLIAAAAELSPTPTAADLSEAIARNDNIQDSGEVICKAPATLLITPEMRQELDAFSGYNLTIVPTKIVCPHCGKPNVMIVPDSEHFICADCNQICINPDAVATDTEII